MDVRKYIVCLIAVLFSVISVAMVNRMNIISTDGKVISLPLRNIEEITFAYDPLLASTNATIDSKEDTLYIDIKGVRMEMVRVPVGTYLRPENETRLTITKEYYIARTEVTQALVEALELRNPSTHIGDSLPVHNVSYQYADSLVEALNDFASLSEYEFALPTEAQWIVAAIGANKSEGYKYAGGNSLSAVAWNSANSDKAPHAVATLLPNEIGLYDMSGNAFELCADWYADLPIGDQTDYENTEKTKYRVIRGGGYANNYLYCQLLKRGAKPSDNAEMIGVRLVLQKK